MTPACARALIRAHFFLLCPKIQIVWLCSTFTALRYYNEHIHAVWHNVALLNISRTLQSAAFILLRLYLVGVPLKSVPVPLFTPKTASESYSFNYDVVLICIHQCYPVSAVMPGVVLRAYSWVLLKPIGKWCLLLLSGASSWIESKPVG